MRTYVIRRNSGKWTGDLFEALRAFCVALGDDVEMKTVKSYITFWRMMRFARVKVRSQGGVLMGHGSRKVTTRLHAGGRSDETMGTRRPIGLSARPMRP